MGFVSETASFSHQRARRPQPVIPVVDCVSSYEKGKEQEEVAYHCINEGGQKMEISQRLRCADGKACAIKRCQYTVMYAMSPFKVKEYEYVQADVQRSFIPPKKSKTLVCMRLCCFHQGMGDVKSAVKETYPLCDKSTS